MDRPCGWLRPYSAFSFNKIIWLLEEVINGGKRKGIESLTNMRISCFVADLFSRSLWMWVWIVSVSVECCVCVCLSVPNLICVLFVTLSNASNGFGHHADGFPHSNFELWLGCHQFLVILWNNWTTTTVCLPNVKYY